MADDGKQTKIRHHYIKGNFFRVVHADGIYGGLTPRGYIHMVMWSERNAIPQEAESTVADDGKIISEQTIKTREGTVRELEIDVIMDLGVAKAFRKWLDEKIVTLEKYNAMEETKGRK